jgi:hypothetical protein
MPAEKNPLSFCRPCRRKHEVTGTPFWKVREEESTDYAPEYAA